MHNTGRDQHRGQGYRAENGLREVGGIGWVVQIVHFVYHLFFRLLRMVFTLDRLQAVELGVQQWLVADRGHDLLGDLLAVASKQQVGLIDHDGLREREVLGLGPSQQRTRRCDHNRRCMIGHEILVVGRQADRTLGDLWVQLTKHFGDLTHKQLGRGHDDHHGLVDRAEVVAKRMCIKLLHQRQQVRQRLARAGLGTDHDVVVVQDLRDGAALRRRGLSDAERCDALHKFVLQPKRVEGSLGSGGRVHRAAAQPRPAVTQGAHQHAEALIHQ